MRGGGFVSGPVASSYVAYLLSRLLLADLMHCAHKTQQCWYHSGPKKELELDQWLPTVGQGGHVVGWGVLFSVNAILSQWATVSKSRELGLAGHLIA